LLKANRQLLNSEYCSGRHIPNRRNTFVRQTHSAIAAIKYSQDSQNPILNLQNLTKLQKFANLSRLFLETGNS